MRKRLFAAIRRLARPRSLRYQLLSRSLLILTALLLLIGVFQYVWMDQFLYRNKIQTIQTQIGAIPFDVWQEIAAHPDNHANDELLSSLRSPDTTVTFIDREGNAFVLMQGFGYRPAPQLPMQPYPPLLNPKVGFDFAGIVPNRHGDKELAVMQAVGPREDPIGIVQVSTRVELLEGLLLRQLSIFIILAVGALVVGLLTFLPTLRRTLIPLSRMVDTVKRINAGNMDERLPTLRVQLEVEQLSTSFNEMLERLQVSFEAEKAAKEKMRRFVADASHELRTPLTSIHGFLEVLLRGAAAKPEQLQKALQSMQSESERVNKLVNELLFLARQDREPDLKLSEARVDQLLYEMEPQLRLLAGARQVRFSIQEQATATIDSDRIKQVILNLFQNAVQHTDPVAGEIEALLVQGNSYVELAIEDNGGGIPEEHLDHLFERFYRVDSARARSSGGAGLGLAISKSIVESHGGTIACASKLGVGTRFIVRLPH